MNFIFVLTCTEEETGETVARIESKSLESLEEQFHKIDSAIDDYVDKQNDYGKDGLDLTEPH